MRDQDTRARLLLSGIEYAYPSWRGHGPRVLHGVDWTVGRGVTGLIGANGSGKTTLLSICAHLTRPTGGTISVADEDGSTVTRHDVVRSSYISFVPQQYTLEETLTVADTLSYLAWLHRTPSARLDAAVDRVIDELNLEALIGWRVGRLSGGQRQRVALACGLIADPRILILDEPTVGLDPATRIEIREILHRLGRTRTVILSTHLIEDLRYIADSVAILHAGRLMYTGPLHEFTKQIPDYAPSPYGDAFENAYRGLMRERGTLE